MKYCIAVTLIFVLCSSIGYSAQRERQGGNQVVPAPRERQGSSQAAPAPRERQGSAQAAPAPRERPGSSQAAPAPAPAPAPAQSEVKPHAPSRPVRSGPKARCVVLEPRPGFDPARDAAQDINQAIAQASLSHKRILLDVGGEWCKWCKMLDAFFESNKDVSALLHEKFIVVKVNFSKENENKEVLSRYPKVPGYPHFFVLNEDGTLLHSQDTGVLEQGQGYDPEKMKAFITQWGN